MDRKEIIRQASLEARNGYPDESSIDLFISRYERIKEYTFSNKTQDKPWLFTLDYLEASDVVETKGTTNYKLPYAYRIQKSNVEDVLDVNVGESPPPAGLSQDQYLEVGWNINYYTLGKDEFIKPSFQYVEGILYCSHKIVNLIIKKKIREEELTSGLATMLIYKFGAHIAQTEKGDLEWAAKLEAKARKAYITEAYKDDSKLKQDRYKALLRYWYQTYYEGIGY